MLVAFCRGILSNSILSHGILSRDILSKAFCLVAFCTMAFCPDPILDTEHKALWDYCILQQ